MTVLQPGCPDLDQAPREFVGPPDADLTTCDREAIHLSEAIQPHGVLLAVSEADLVVRRASANTAEHLGAEPSELLGESLARSLGTGAADQVRTALAAQSAQSGPLTIFLRHGLPYELTWHRVAGTVVVELEPADAEGVASLSAAFEGVRHAIHNLQVAKGVQALCESAAAQIRHLTGYDRVMIYRFHPDWHGEVVAEARADELEPYLGLHYPATDIPHQARKLYLLNHLRVIADVDYSPVPLLGLATEPAALDLSLSGLRSVSPFHLAYLHNMGVQATLTISLMRGTQLWGMVACHHSSPRRLDASLRAACRVLGQVFSLQVVTQEDHDRSRRRADLADIELALVARMTGAESLAEALGSPPQSALALTGADGMVARIDGQTVTAGVVPPTAAVDALLALLCRDEDPVALICDDIPDRFVELAPYADRAAGVLALPLSAGYQDFVVWFRGELVHERLWAGDPRKATVNGAGPAGGPAVLGPRHSFAAWAEEVRGRSRPWLEAEIDAARALSGTVPEFQLARARVHLADMARVAHLATHDPLTGLVNRTLLIERVALALGGPHRDERPVVLLFVDLDRFKLVNDSLGHAAGDALLCQAAGRLTGCVRPDDTVARIGGDEFVVLCEDLTATQAHQLADRIVEAFRKPFVLDGHEAMVTTSIGVAWAESGTDPVELLRNADSAMYRAKHSGRNAATPFTHEMRASTLRRIEIETKLRPALERGDLRLHFQPVLTSTGVLTGFEALARWPLAGSGSVPPSEFIPVAESLGLSPALTDWVLETGLSAVTGWRRLRPDLDLSMAVNIPASLMTDDKLRRSIDAALLRHQLPPQALCLEITEPALVTDDALSQRFLTRMRTRGVRLSIDDFGTGFSSLAYLPKLPVHELKIDRAFIARLPASHADVTVVASVVGLAHQLGLQALAEGVETADQLATVRRLGCDLVQGYIHARPMPADAIDRYLAAAPRPGAGDGQELPAD